MKEAQRKKEGGSVRLGSRPIPGSETNGQEPRGAQDGPGGPGGPALRGFRRAQGGLGGPPTRGAQGAQHPKPQIRFFEHPPCLRPPGPWTRCGEGSGSSWPGGLGVPSPEMPAPSSVKTFWGLGYLLY